MATETIYLITWGLNSCADEDELLGFVDNEADAQKAVAHLEANRPAEYSTKSSYSGELEPRGSFFFQVIHRFTEHTNDRPAISPDSGENPQQ